MTARQTPPEVEEETPMEALQRQVTAQEEVLRDYKKTIDELRAELAKAKNDQEDKINAAAAAAIKPLADEVGMYRTLIEGWPKGQELIERLTRYSHDDDDYDYDY